MTERIKRGDSSLMAARRKIILTECSAGGKSAKQLAVAISRKCETVMPLLREMRKDGLLFVVGYGQWAAWARADHVPVLQAEMEARRLLPEKPGRRTREAMDRRNAEMRQQRLDRAAGVLDEDEGCDPVLHVRQSSIAAAGAPPLRITSANSVFAWGLAA